MGEPFAKRLDAITATRGKLCVGVDPHPASVAAWGLPDDIAGLEKFSRGLVAALADDVACFKPQSAFFEAFGPAGLTVLAAVLRDIADAGAISILDVKRGDIGSTMDAYARAYLADGAPLAADAITVSPFQGFGSLSPAIDLAKATGRGVFVLARTSNTEGEAVQLAAAYDGPNQSSIDSPNVGSLIASQAADANKAAGTPLVGLVIGATLNVLDINLQDFDGWVLAPGIGAQGGTMEHLRGLFAGHPDAWPRVLPTVSRSVADAGPDQVSLKKVAHSLLQWPVF
ncbi:MAG: orotidine-5'-phosphate decarboxylase [Propionibacteriaceae bacterium]|nr:orotidine-5'-phosphate decarboxylase [Propionibacteriaceae bacterium]